MHPFPLSNLNPHRFLFTLAAALVTVAVTLAPALPVQRPHHRLYVDFSKRPSAAALISHNICFLDAKAEAELGPGRALGHHYYARLNTVAVAPACPAGVKAADSGLAIKTAHAQWDHLLLDVLHPQWLEWVLDQQAKTAAQSGFAGFLVDGAAALEELDSLRPRQSASQRGAFIAMVIELRRRFPDMPVVLRGGFDLVNELRGHITGILAEDVLQKPATDREAGADHASLSFRPEAELAIRKAQIAGLKVYAVETGDRLNHSGNLAAAERLASIGCVPFITTAERDGTLLGPVLPQSRHTLVLHGWDSNQEARQHPPALESWSARTLAPALRWLDLAPRYVDVSEWSDAQASPDRLLQPRPAGIILDPGLRVPAARQAAFAEWLVLARSNGIPIVLSGQPFDDAAAWTQIAAALDLGGSGQAATTLSLSNLSGFEASWFLQGRLPEARALRPLNLQAPGKAVRLLGYRCKTATGEPASFDACFLADWGGAWLESSCRAPLDPFPFLQAALRLGQSGPVPDTTTLAGHQIYLSTVQGRGFDEPSWQPENPLCSESLLAELRNFPGLPVTIAVAEADVRGWSAAADPAAAMHYETVARALFSLPQVEPASNSYSRPLNWLPESFQPGPLQPLIPDQRVGIEREIAGSLSYIKRRLVPPGKNLRFFLWPEGAAPGQAALDHLSQTGASQLPGSWQTGWNVAPVSSTPATGCANPDSADAIAAAWFQTQLPAEGSPRISPIHLAYAFADLKKTATRDALRQIWSWCDAQPLHPMTASSFAALLEDAAAMEIHPQAENHWLVVSSGHPATLRLPEARGLPDMARCRGVTGYTRHGGQTYIHLGGQSLSEIILRSTADEKPHLHLVEADRPVDFYELRPQSARFRPQGRDSTLITLGGLTPGGWYEVTASGSHARLQAKADGRLDLRAPPLATVSIQPSPVTGKPYAAR